VVAPVAPVDWGPASLIPAPLRSLLLGEGLLLGTVGGWAALMLWIVDRRKGTRHRK
jgi:hypothetical protein